MLTRTGFFALLVVLTASASVNVAQAHPGLHERIELLTAELARDPDSVPVLLRRGRAWQDDGHWELALADYQRAADLAPADLRVRLHRGQALLAGGRPGEALPDLVAVTSTLPEHAEARWALARALAASGRLAEAAEQYAWLGAAQPQVDRCVEHARVLQEAGRPEAALRVLAEASRALGFVVALERTAWEIESAARLHQAALRRLERLVEGSTRPEHWLVEKAALLQSLGRHDEALEAYRAARTALDARPPHRRGIRALEEIDARVEQGLTALSPFTPSGGVQP